MGNLPTTATGLSSELDARTDRRLPSPASMIVTSDDAKTLGLAVVLSAIVIVCLWIGFDR